MAEPASQSQVTLYWLEKSRAQRIVWLLEELKINYDFKIYKRTKEGLADPALKKVHALGKSPVIGVRQPDGEPLILAESGALIEYLVDHFGQWLVPKKWQEGKEGQIGGETPEYLRYRFFMHYAEGSLMNILVVAVIVNNIENAPVPFFIKPIIKGIAGKVKSVFLQPNFNTHFAFLEEQLASSPNGGEYLCGKELTSADFLMNFPLEAASVRAGLTKDKYPKVHAYLEKIQAREAYKHAIERTEKETGEKYVLVNV